MQECKFTVILDQCVNFHSSVYIPFLQVIYTLFLFLVGFSKKLLDKNPPTLQIQLLLQRVLNFLNTLSRSKIEEFIQSYNVKTRFNAIMKQYSEYKLSIKCQNLQSTIKMILLGLTQYCKLITLTQKNTQKQRAIQRIKNFAFVRNQLVLLRINQYHIFEAIIYIQDSKKLILNYLYRCKHMYSKMSIIKVKQIMKHNSAMCNHPYNNNQSYCDFLIKQGRVPPLSLTIISSTCKLSKIGYNEILVYVSRNYLSGEEIYISCNQCTFSKLAFYTIIRARIFALMTSII
ncbi:unnamed protein product (macronuclear) [Paramecium tetraurelia]|uniref:DNA-directed RNA polymerase n=1 Tax=Paramecium tetraurelia TaxID=5888 RepID=A0DL35_PARTE|nr:uncharacterized protein GSPATT00018069001 [Paramecium tetraurelia]CAK83752.1 unnamed protein product [Paramecium tetraurelia]|eukprot:XP_001451149.1 hypothetical protein (macronuclear) [Paramecium tetraurelia strain d4-2]